MAPSWITALVLTSPLVTDQEEFITELRHPPEGWWGVGVFALVVLLGAAVVAMYRSEGRAGSSSRLRTVLGGLRCLVLVVLVVILMEPIRVRILHRRVDSYTVVLVDESSSMDLADRYSSDQAAQRVRAAFDASPALPVRRHDLVEQILSRKDRAWLSDLAARNRVRLYGFASQPTRWCTIRSAGESAGSPGGAIDPPSDVVSVQDAPISVAAEGPTTNIERALRRAVEALGSAPLAGVIVLSDGGFNEGGTPEEAARFVRDRSAPLYSVGVGDPTSPRNLRIVEVAAPENVLRKDPFEISVRISGQGMTGERIQVRLRERDESSGGEGRIVETIDRVLDARGGALDVMFRRSPDRVGRFGYVVDIPPVPDEAVVEDNSRPITVNVIDSRLRVLVVAGAPGWDFRFVSRLLERDESVDVSCWLQSADVSAVRDGNTIIDHLPRTPDDLFAYDAILLFDPNPEELDAEWVRLVDQWVEKHGGGLLFAAARPFTPRFFRTDSLEPLLRLLPVVPDPEAELVLNRIGHYQQSSSPVEISESGYGHSVVQLADDVVMTKLLWQGMGGVYWHFPVLREKPAATVLMRHGDPRMRGRYGQHVLAAVQYVGAGRTGFLGFDGTFRWRQRGEDLFDRFWIQMTRFLAEGKLLGGARRGLLDIDQDQHSLGDSVLVRARLLDERYEPIRADEVTAVREVNGDRDLFPLRKVPDQAGWYEGRFVADRIGTHRVTVSLPPASASTGVELGRDIQVMRPNIEMLNPQMDRDQLVRLAGGTKGGRYFEIDELGLIPGLIPDLHEQVPIRSRPVTLWDRQMVLGALAGLLGLEWLLRKLNRLL